MIMSTPIPLLLSTNSLTIENHLYEIITERSKACATFLRNSIRRAVGNSNSIGWNVGLVPEIEVRRRISS